MTINYHEGHRRLQDWFESRRIADRLDEVTARTAFTDDDKTFIKGRHFFFIATATAAGHPTCNLKGGAPGFARVIAPDVLAFPDYDGNGMFLSLGNIVANPHAGLLFIDFERSKRLRVDGEACVSTDGRRPADCAGQGARDLSKLSALHTQDATHRTVDLCAARRRRSAGARVEGVA